MLLTLLAAAAANVPCPTNDIRQAAQIIVEALRRKDFRCLRRMTVDPDLTFDGDRLNRDVADSLDFHAPGNRSFNDILNRNGVEIAIKGSGAGRQVLLIDRKYYQQYLRNPGAFTDKYLWKQYFYCNVEQIGGVWKLTQSVCNTEGDDGVDE